MSTAAILGDDRSKPISRHQEQRSSADLAANGGTFSYAAQIPLKDLKPGVYSMRFEAISRLEYRDERRARSAIQRHAALIDSPGRCYVLHPVLEDEHHSPIHHA